MGIDLESVFRKIGLEFDSTLGTYVHKKTRIPLTVRFDYERGKLVLLDQTKLPFELAVWSTTDWKGAAFSGIRDMITRGSQSIGCTAGYCILLAAISLASDQTTFLRKLKAVGNVIKGARPTAVPLTWAVKKTFSVAQKAIEGGGSVEEAIQAIGDEADLILASDLILCSFLRNEGRRYLRDGDVILTHCNAGSLSSSYGGHALGMIEEAVVDGMDLLVVSKETRPRSQGFKLTTWELIRAGVPVIIITDNMVSSAISRYNISKIIVGADRISRDGSLANKIGTHDLAIIASAFKKPFYVATGCSTIDIETARGSDIPIEERDRDEVLYPYRLEARDRRTHGILSGRSLTQWPTEGLISEEDIPSKGKASVYNPAFDVTPPELIDRYITDIGSYRPKEITSLTEEAMGEKVRRRLEDWGLRE